ncbi:histidine kinase [Flavicella sp.]|uniref:sensor histidine kinase n=1 Tax=Flavicella sp. TaxID=2957742 RepID=UPI003016C480
MTSLLSWGQGSNIVPTELSDSVLGSWMNDKNEIVLIIKEDYIIIQDKLFYYYEIIREKHNLNFTIANNTDVKYFSVNSINSKSLFLDEGFKVSKLKKATPKELKEIPESILGNWFSPNAKILFEKDKIVFSGDTYTIDCIIGVAPGKQHFILYKHAEFFYAYTFNNGIDLCLQTCFNGYSVFKKESFFRKHLMTIVIICVISFMILIYCVFKWRLVLVKNKEISKRKFTEIQLKSIRSQMNPHFLFNSLSAIQNLINKGDNDKANHYLTEFSQLMRLTLNNSEKGLVSLFDDLESISKYLELEKLRFCFVSNITIAKEVNCHEIEIPAMLIQPFVENSINHGLKGKKGAKLLSITIKIEKGNLCCLIEDNGIGINKSQLNKSSNLNHIPFGLKLAKDRLNLINENYKTNAKIIITDISDIDQNKTGTCVEIYLPLFY